MNQRYTFNTFVGMTAAAFVLVTALSTSVLASSKGQDLLVKFKPEAATQMRSVVRFMTNQGQKAEILTDSWMRVQVSGQRSLSTLSFLKNSKAIEYVQPNYKLKLLENYQIQDAAQRAALSSQLGASLKTLAKADNPAIPAAPQQAAGADPDFSKQWGMNDIGVKDAWTVSTGSPEMIVAVIDTGVDYTHEDLLPNLWRNSKEIEGNGIDDDNNGFVDDMIGWDFVSNDNLPYDLAVEPTDLLMGGGNPGHGTHCAGNVAAKGNNSLGIAGVAPNVKIMSLRFLSEKGEGTSADAIKAIKYAVDNGARVLSNSWGSEGEDSAEEAENKALREIIAYAQEKGTLFIAAAGNGHQGKGYDNDTDAAPGYPASYDHETIISVAAVDVNNQLGSFSNWGAKTVDIGAPGVDVYSTIVGGSYSNYVIDLGPFQITWDGTSMAAPHVAGAAALYWSAHPTKTWREVKAAIIGSAQEIPALSGKAVSNGKLDVKALMNF